MYSEEAANDFEKKISKLKHWCLTYRLCMLIGVPLSILWIGLAGVVLGTVIACFMLKHLWSLIPREDAETTPGRAVGFLFIPVFNIYWVFISILGIAKALNAQTNRLSIPDVRVSEGRAKTACILACLLYIPILDLIILAVVLIYAIWMWKEMIGAGVALLEHRHHQMLVDLAISANQDLAAMDDTE